MSSDGLFDAARNHKALKVQARHVTVGDVIVPTRTSPESHGHEVMHVSKVAGKVRLTLGGKPDGAYQEHHQRQEVYVITRKGGL